MPITPEEIRALALDARLEVTENEMPDMTRYLDNFLNELERMNELDLRDVPLFDFAEANSCPMREDEVRVYPHMEDILAAAPGREGNFYRAGRILED